MAATPGEKDGDGVGDGVGDDAGDDVGLPAGLAVGKVALGAFELPAELDGGAEPAPGPDPVGRTGVVLPQAPRRTRQARTRARRGPGARRMSRG
jgi:hypothetical protein